MLDGCLTNSCPLRSFLPSILGCTSIKLLCLLAVLQSSRPCLGVCQLPVPAGMLEAEVAARGEPSPLTAHWDLKAQANFPHPPYTFSFREQLWNAYQRSPKDIWEAQTKTGTEGCLHLCALWLVSVPGVSWGREVCFVLCLCVFC